MVQLAMSIWIGVFQAFDDLAGAFQPRRLCFASHSAQQINETSRRGKAMFTAQEPNEEVKGYACYRTGCIPPRLAAYPGLLIHTEEQTTNGSQSPSPPGHAGCRFQAGFSS